MNPTKFSLNVSVVLLSTKSLPFGKSHTVHSTSANVTMSSLHLMPCLLWTSWLLFHYLLCPFISSSAHIVGSSPSLLFSRHKNILYIFFFLTNVARFLSQCDNKDFPLRSSLCIPQFSATVGRGNKMVGGRGTRVRRERKQRGGRGGEEEYERRSKNTRTSGTT